ncbi:MAG TPA: phosphoribosylformylglycinamidine synthase subunit PurS [Alphaproteobacteria bacterium]|nr:phosphoribosylformylglycinamidine synthase subunit PurS [Alphaproteobacteria bacterium]HIB17693.1 phosphoribosylformylglycinamidine synthase subunit PurS [Alphaproteobacteria bacterium]HIB55685.1 phosphoribosylformylglycinamidine synthase subunit PurS [Alphaproteobacteria bacterium]HIC71896.1 phosphoribosylformylglycinamidine synthase subunit PurS [Alphaproteobacteria bacterium]
MKAKIHITLKRGVLDPRGKATEQALTRLGFEGVKEVRQGKVLELNLTESNPERARTALENMCKKLLANTVIEDYSIELDG